MEVEGVSDAKTLLDELEDAVMDIDADNVTLMLPVEEMLVKGENVLEDERVPEIEGLEESEATPELVEDKQAEALAE